MKKKKLEKKILELFEYRKIPYLLSFFEPKQSRKLLKKLIALQHAIYLLDAYLEQNWKLKNRMLKKRWSKIYECLEDLGLDKDDSTEMVAHIRRYQKHEMQLREGLYPVRLNTEYYYHYKSCDVRLMREILYKKNPDIGNYVKQDAWRYFDLITEVNDDVEDVFEDQVTINGNHFLLSIILEGSDKAKSKFDEFLNQLSEKSKKLGNVGSDTKKLEDWFEHDLKQTRNLIDENLILIQQQKKNPSSPIFTC